MMLFSQDLLVLVGPDGPGRTWSWAWSALASTIRLWVRVPGRPKKPTRQYMPRFRVIKHMFRAKNNDSNQNLLFPNEFLNTLPNMCSTMFFFAHYTSNRCPTNIYSFYFTFLDVRLLGPSSPSPMPRASSGWAWAWPENGRARGGPGPKIRAHAQGCCLTKEFIIHFSVPKLLEFLEKHHQV